jgi:hypothetical protein
MQKRQIDTILNNYKTVSLWTESTQIIFVYLFSLSINIESNLAV